MSVGRAQTTGLGASDAASRLNQPRFESRIGNSVDAGTGAFILEKEILSIQGGRDLPFNIVHNSLLSRSEGAMGFGWSHQYEAFVDGDPAGTVTVHWDALRKNSFGSASGAAYEPLDEAVRYDTYGSDNILETFQQQAVTYDRNGNMTNGPIGNSIGPFRYDHKNNLVSAGPVTYLYDEEDHLIGFTAGGRTTRLVLDPRPELSQVLMETGPDGAIRRYMYGIGLIYEESGGRTRTYHYDHRGSTVALSSDDGSISGTISYGPDGEVLSRDGETSSLFLFAIPPTC